MTLPAARPPGGEPEPPPQGPPTNPSLLVRLGRTPHDQMAWAEFVDRYGPMVCGWCRRWNLQQADADDVVQIVLAKLAARVRTFDYDPSKSFRAWLKTVARHAWHDFIGTQQRPGLGSGDSGVAAWLGAVEAREDFARRLEEAFDHELLEAASLRVRLRVSALTWDMYRLTALEGVPPADAAARLGVTVVRVFKVKSKVIGMLRDEVARLEGSP